MGLVGLLEERQRRKSVRRLLAAKREDPEKFREIIRTSKNTSTLTRLEVYEHLVYLGDDDARNTNRNMKDFIANYSVTAYASVLLGSTAVELGFPQDYVPMVLSGLFMGFFLKPFKIDLSGNYSQARQDARSNAPPFIEVPMRRQVRQIMDDWLSAQEDYVFG
jgi:hypothetical protein